MHLLVSKSVPFDSSWAQVEERSCPGSVVTALESADLVSPFDALCFLLLLLNQFCLLDGATIRPLLFFLLRRKGATDDWTSRRPTLHKESSDSEDSVDGVDYDEEKRLGDDTSAAADRGSKKSWFMRSLPAGPAAVPLLLLAPSDLR